MGNDSEFARKYGLVALWDLFAVLVLVLLVGYTILQFPRLTSSGGVTSLASSSAGACSAHCATGAPGGRTVMRPLKPGETGSAWPGTDNTASVRATT